MRIACSAAFVTAVFVTAPAFAATCESIAALKLTATTITAAQVVAAGAFKPSSPVPAGPGGAVPPDAFEKLPAFCRVQGVIQPTSDSHIEFEVWLPMSGWNRKYFGVGNGGLAGSVIYASSAALASNTPSLRDALSTGYAASSTDTGHQASQGDARWALGHPEQIVDFGWQRPQAFLLRQLFKRRPSGADGGTAIPIRLRRPHRRRTWSWFSYANRGLVHLEPSGHRD
jgi:feruloyl esterase